MKLEEWTPLIISGIASGGLISGFVALRKDMRDKRDGIVSLTQQAQDIADKAVKTVREELTALENSTEARITALEKRIVELETALKMKDHIITLLVTYVGNLRQVPNMVKPSHPLPEVPDELKDYLKEDK